MQNRGYKVSSVTPRFCYSAALLLYEFQHLDLRFWKFGILRRLLLKFGKLPQGEATGHSIFGLDAIAGNVQRGARSLQKVCQRINLIWGKVVLNDQGRRIAKLLGAVWPLNLKTKLWHWRRVRGEKGEIWRLG